MPAAQAAARLPRFAPPLVSEVASPIRLSSLRHLPDRWLHDWRRRRAIRSIQASRRHGTIAFICYGNICRSPFAAAVFRKRLGDRAAAALVTAVRSAGFVEPDRTSPPAAIASATRFGVDLSNHRSTVITTELMRDARLVVTMSGDQARDVRRRFSATGAGILVLGDLDPVPIETRTIRDPWREPREVFDETYRRIDRCIRVLVNALTEDQSAGTEG